MTYDAAHGQLFTFGGETCCSSDSDTWVWQIPQNMGNVNVCPSGHTTPAPCSSTLGFNYDVATTTAFGTPKVVTQGASALDFTLASDNTCTGTIFAGNSCTVNVTFAPLAPGLRLGAVQLFDDGGNVLATSAISGIGQGPALAFGPGTQTTVSTGSFSLNQPKGVVVDAAGNLFIADNGNQRVVKVAANGTQTTVGFGLQYPQGLAVDGAGDLFIADNNLPGIEWNSSAHQAKTMGLVWCPKYKRFFDRSSCGPETSLGGRRVVVQVALSMLALAGAGDRPGFSEPDGMPVFGDARFLTA